MAPQFVGAHRALQNLELEEHRRGELLVRYRALRDGAPRSADRWYLWGRVLSHADEQRTAFETARRLDPTFPWPWLGLGALELAAGRVETAVALLRRGRELAPDLRDLELALVRALLASEGQLAEAERLLAGGLDAEPWDVARVLLLGDLRARQERPREAIELLGRLLARVPGNGEVASRLLERLERDGTVEDARWLERELGVASNEPLVLPIVARCHAMRGDAGAAISTWNALPDLASEERAWRRLLRVLRGEVAEVLTEEAPRFAALARLGGRSVAWDEVTRLASDLSRSEAADPTELAAAFSRLGWVEEAIALLRPSAGAAPPSERASRLLVRLFAQRQLEAELKSLALETYRRFDEHHDSRDFAAFRERIAAVARRALGDELEDGPATLSFWPVGEMLDSTAEGGLPGYFRQRGRMLIAGQRSGRPPELFLASVLGEGVAGPQKSRLCFVDDTLIPGWLEHQGARFAGAALDRVAYVDVAAVDDDVSRILAIERRLGAARERVLADPVLLASDRDERVRVTEPAEVSTKLELRALDDWRAREPQGDRASLLAEALDAVLMHETAHLEDADRFLPISRQLFRNLLELVRHGFSSTRIESWFEMRAQCVALARAKNPYLVLADCTAQAAGGGKLTPHGGGYQELLERFVALLEDAPHDFPTLDRRRNLLQQVDRLSPEEIRLAAHRLLADLDIE